MHQYSSGGARSLIGACAKMRNNAVTRKLFTLKILTLREIHPSPQWRRSLFNACTNTWMSLMWRPQRIAACLFLHPIYGSHNPCHLKHIVQCYSGLNTHHLTGSFFFNQSMLHSSLRYHHTGGDYHRTIPYGEITCLGECLRSRSTF